MNPLDAILDPLAYPFFVRALVAASVVGLVCAVVGSYMVLRGLAFMGDALSHSAFPGVVAAYLLKGPFYLGAAIAAVGTALAIGWVTRTGRLRGDTAIGVLFAGMFALGIFLFSRIPNYVGDLFGFLFGEILGIGDGDLLALTLLAVLVLAIVAVLWKELLYSTFDPLGAAAAGLPVARLDYLFLALIALTIVVSLQAVGIILVVAMLVTPAAVGQLVATSFGRLVGVAIAVGITGPIVGLYLSYWLDAATGATIVLVETAVFLVVLVVKRGPWTSRA
jgi:manganese/iron transport system permease protein